MWDDDLITGLRFSEGWYWKDNGKADLENFESNKQRPATKKPF